MRRRTGPRLKHGGFSIVNKAALIKDRKRLARYLEETREELVSDLGPREEGLTRAQKILIDRVIAKLGTLRLIEIYLGEKGVFEREGELRPIFERYLQFARELRNDLSLLGVKTRKKDDFLDLGAYFKAKGREEEAQEPRQDAQDGPIQPSPGEEQGLAKAEAQEASIQDEGGDHDEGDGGQT